MGPESDDPLYLRLFEHAAAQPDAWEDHPWGDLVFKVGAKMFACLSHDPTRVTVKGDKEDLDGLLALPFIERAPYVGRYGWLTVHVETEEALDLAVELISTSHRLVAGSKSRTRRK